jgi:Icc-related predicted phosphoesterase
VDRVAVLSDVHGNVPALAAVLGELSSWQPDLVVFCGDLTWGCEPDQTIELVRDLRQTSYDVEEAVRRDVAVGDPRADVIERMLRHPPTPDEIIADAESLVFSD